MNVQFGIAVDYEQIDDAYLACAAQSGIEAAHRSLVEKAFLASTVGQLADVQSIPWEVVDGTDTIAMQLTDEQKLAVNLAMDDNQFMRDEIRPASYYDIPKPARGKW